MNIFDAQTAFCVALIAVIASTTMLAWSYRDKSSNSNLLKMVGYFVLTLSLISLLCTTYNMIKYWEHGAFSSKNHVPRRPRDKQGKINFKSYQTKHPHETFQTRRERFQGVEHRGDERDFERHSRDDLPEVLNTNRE